MAMSNQPLSNLYGGEGAAGLSYIYQLTLLQPTPLSVYGGLLYYTYIWDEDPPYIDMGAEI